MKRNRLYGITIIMCIISVVITGCVDMPMPENTIAPPKVSASNSTTMEAVVQPFLIEDFELLHADNSSGKFPIITDDFDGDGNEEILLFYGHIHKQRASGVMLLEKINNKWEKKWDSTDDALKYTIIDYHILDLKGDGQEVLILDVGHIVNTKMIQMMSLGEEVSHLYTTECNTLEFIYEEDKNPALAIWINVVTNVDYIEVIRWNNDSDAFEQVTYDVSDYYEKLLPFYKDLAGGEVPYSITKYYYADILMKANRFEEALEVIEEYLADSTKLQSMYIMKGNFVKGKCAYMLGDVDKALEALEISNSQFTYYVDKRLEGLELAAIIYEQMGDDENAEMSRALIEKHITRFNEWDYKRLLWLNR